MIKTQNLSKSFRVTVKSKQLFKRQFQEKVALKDLNLEIGPGELVGLVGDNGAGKTTLVKLLSGIIHPTSGSASVLDYTPWKRDYLFRQQISLVMGQKAQLWWDLPAADSFELLKHIYRIEAKAFETRLGELLEILSLQELLNIPLRQLSLGERMKMELVAALLHQPRVIFLDEPTIGLDNQSQKAIRKFLKEYCQKYRPAVILTSHYMDDIEQLAQRVLLLQKGSLVYDGELSYLIANHAKEKLITLYLTSAISKDELEKILQKFEARLVHFDSAEVKISCSRTRIKELAAELIQSLNVEDLRIEEPELASIIQAVFGKQAHA